MLASIPPHAVSWFDYVIKGLPPGLWFGTVLIVALTFGAWRLWFSIWTKMLTPWMDKRQALEQQRTEQHRLLAAAAESNERSSENNRLAQQIGLERDKWQGEVVTRMQSVTTRLEAVHDRAAKNGS